MAIKVDYIVDALASLGGEAHLDQITERVREIAPPPLPPSTAAVIRARMQERCFEARSYKHKDDLFESVYGVAARKGRWRLKRDPLDVGAPDSFQDGAEVFIDAEEGRATLRIHLRRERSSILVRAFKESLRALTCVVCNFDFERRYGPAGAGYIEAHHTIPVSALKEGERTDMRDLVALCANCHRIVHRNGLIDWRELRRYQESKNLQRDRDDDR